MPRDVPCIGDVIYVDWTDVVHKTYLTGGKATVSAVWETNDNEILVEVEEVPGGEWTWSYLEGMQDELDLKAGKAGLYVTFDTSGNLINLESGKRIDKHTYEPLE